MSLPSLTEKSDEVLIENLRLLKTTESETVADIVLYLAEVNRRQLYREAGYSSLFAFCTQSLGYSDGSAYRRFQASRTLDSNPEVYELLRSGKLTLCAVAEVSKVITPENKEVLLEGVQGKPKIEVQRIVSEYKPIQERPRREVIKPVMVKALPLFSQNESPIESRSLHIEVDSAFMELLDKAKATGGVSSTAELLKRSLRQLIDRRVPKLKRKVRSNLRSRYVPRSVRHEVMERDGCQCTFVSQEGKRCLEKHGLEFDHVVPFSRGGLSEASNLRLLCRAHNQLSAENTLGKEFMRTKKLTSLRSNQPTSVPPA